MRLNETITPSPYGNPELAMMQDREESPPDYSDEQIAVMSELLSKLSERDRLLIYLHLEKREQSEIARMLGLTQPSVHTKIKSIMSWCTRVLPYRLALLDAEIYPKKWTCEIIRFYDGVVHDHAPAQSISTRSGTLFTWVTNDMREHGTKAQFAIADLLVTDSRKWTRPGTRAPNKREYPKPTALHLL